MFKFLGAYLDEVFEAIGTVVLGIIVLIGWIFLSVFDIVKRLFTKNY
jgi:hypothetical protein